VSNEDKRSGIRDIRTLRERLGKVKKNVSAGSEAEGEQQATQGLLEPAPNSGGSTSPSASDTYDNTLNQNDAAIDAGDGSPNAAEPIASSASTGGEAQFAHPLQVGSYTQAAAAPELSAADLQELEEYERKHSARTKVIASVGGSLLLVGLLFGYLSGSTMDARIRHNFSIETAKSVESDLEITYANISQVRDALMGEVKRLEGLQGKLTGELKLIKKAKDAKDSEGMKAAKLRAFAIKAVIDRGIDFALVASKMPTELALSTDSLLKQSHALSSVARKQLGRFLLETDRYFRSVGVFQKTAKAIARINDVSTKRFGSVLAIDLTAGDRNPAFKSLPKNLQTGQFVRFNRAFVDALGKPADKKTKPSTDISVLGLSVPDDGPSTITSAKKLVAVSTLEAVNVAAHVYPVIRQVLMVQFQELEELGKSLNASGDTMKALLSELSGQETQFTL
jgi:hypothetical protein